MRHVAPMRHAGDPVPFLEGLGDFAPDFLNDARVVWVTVRARFASDVLGRINGTEQHRAAHTTTHSVPRGLEEADMADVGWVESHGLDLDDEVVVSELGDANGKNASLALLLVDDSTD